MMAATAQTTDVSLALAPEPGSAARARRALVRAGLDDDIEHTVSLLATELVTNAVRHAGMRDGDRVVLLATLAPDYARVEVHDGGPGFDPGVRHGAKGFGLRLIDTLSTRWGTKGPPGFSTWFEVDRRKGRRFTRSDGDPATSRPSRARP
jgi:two-component sensor histidine kinase